MHPKIEERVKETLDRREEELIDSREALIDGLQAMQDLLENTQDEGTMVPALNQIYEGAKGTAVYLSPTLETKELGKWELLVSIVASVNALTNRVIDDMAAKSERVRS